MQSDELEECRSALARYEAAAGEEHRFARENLFCWRVWQLINVYSSRDLHSVVILSLFAVLRPHGESRARSVGAP